MLDTLVQSIENTFVQFSIRRLLYVAFLLAVTLGGLFTFDRTTGYSAQKKLEMRLSALERLSTLEAKGVQASSTLGPLYAATVAELRNAPTPAIVWRFDVEPLVKFIAAALIPLLFVIWGLLSMARGTAGAGSTFGGALVATIVMGVPAVFLPTVGSLKATAFFIFVVQALLMWSMVRFYGAKQVQ